MMALSGANELTDAAKLATLEAGAATLKELANILGLFQRPLESEAADDDALVNELMQLLIGMSISRYLAANGTAGLARIFVSGKSRVPRPPPRINAIDRVCNF